jgi:predicted nucleic acid-binding protein
MFASGSISTQGEVVATPMEYDVLRELYSSAMAALTRLELRYGIDTAQFKEAKDNFVRVWLNEVKRKELEAIDYQAAAQKMKEAAKPWITISDEFFKKVINRNRTI